MAELVSPLNQALFHLGGDQVTWAEALGFGTGALCVWLTVRGQIANFAVGIANAAFFLVLFLSASLWATAGLQVVFIVLGLIGWWQWRYGGADRTPLVVGRASGRLLLTLLAVVVVGTAGLTVLLGAANGSVPFWDALAVSLSLAAQWLLNAKKIETWYFWIAVDCIYIPLYVSQNLNLTAVVYLLFLGLCLVGLRTWRRTATLQRDSLTAESVVV